MKILIVLIVLIILISHQGIFLNGKVVLCTACRVERGKEIIQIRFLIIEIREALFYKHFHYPYPLLFI